MNWLYVYGKDSKRIEFILNMNSILAIHLEYHKDTLDKIVIFMPNDVYRLNNTFDQDKILKQLGL